jgi:hypothetical protein
MISHLIEEQSRLDRIYEVRDGQVYDVTDQEAETDATASERGEATDE